MNHPQILDGYPVTSCCIQLPSVTHINDAIQSPLAHWGTSWASLWLWQIRPLASDGPWPWCMMGVGDRSSWWEDQHQPWWKKTANFSKNNDRTETKSAKFTTRHWDSISRKHRKKQQTMVIWMVRSHDKDTSRKNMGTMFFFGHEYSIIWCVIYFASLSFNGIVYLFLISYWFSFDKICHPSW